MLEATSEPPDIMQMDDDDDEEEDDDDERNDSSESSGEEPLSPPEMEADNNHALSEDVNIMEDDDSEPEHDHSLTTGDEVMIPPVVTTTSDKEEEEEVSHELVADVEIPAVVTTSTLPALTEEEPAKPLPAAVGVAASAVTASSVARHSGFSLTLEQQAFVDTSIANADPNQEIVFGGERLTMEELKCLRPSEWLNEGVINMYMALINARSRTEASEAGLPRCYAMSSYFYTKLSRGRTFDYSRVKNWLKKADIDVVRDCDMVLVPVFMGNHWCLAVVNIRDHKFEFYDSLGTNDAPCLPTLRMWLIAEKNERHPAEEMDIESWPEVIHDSDIPVQQNGTDCGVFTCKYAECVSADRPCAFTQYDILALRNRMKYEILTHSILPIAP